MHQRHLVVPFAMLLALAGCASQSGPPRPLLYRYYSHDLIVQPTPPRFVIEAVGSKPGYVWARSYARWDGHGFVKVPGHWMPARTDSRYVDPRWKRYRDGWHFKPGYWLSL